ncbi:hypothetical protein X971_1539 [Agrobacterium tumefaciens LBA4213 (Ach5)]|nr:hypothetical protein X971_1539 [Agrobacterium tumefaciens LBA4213 (Ach5)]
MESQSAKGWKEEQSARLDKRRLPLDHRPPQIPGITPNMCSKPFGGRCGGREYDNAYSRNDTGSRQMSRWRYLSIDFLRRPAAS